MREKKTGATRKDEEKARAARKDEDEDGPRALFLYVAIVLVVGFLFLSILGYVVGYSTLTSGMKDEARLFLKDVLFAIGSACLVSLIFGFLLEMRATSNFVIRKLSDLIFGDEYLRRIGPSLPDLKRRIDRVLLGEQQLASQHGLYNFVETRLDSLFKSSVRRNMSSEVRCQPQPGGVLLWLHKTSYTYVHNRLDPDDPAIKTSGSIDIPPALMPKSEDEWLVAFNKIVSRLAIRIDDHEYESSSLSREKLMPRKGNPASCRMPESLEAKFDFQEGKLNYHVICDVPLEFVTKHPEFNVDIVDEHLSLRESGNLLYSAVIAPTENFSLDCYFPNDARLEPGRFSWRSLPEMRVLKTEQGSIAVKIPGWLLQGEGACVAWFLPEQTAAERAIAEALKSSTLSAAPETPETPEPVKPEQKPEPKPDV